MDIMLDNEISKNVFKVDNLLAPFHKSISCWAITAIGVLDIVHEVRVLNQWKLENHLMEWSIVFLTTIAVLGFLFRYRMSLTQLLENSNVISDGAVRPLRRMSSAILAISGAVLICIAIVLRLG